MKIAIPRLLVPSASIAIDTATHGAYFITLVERPKFCSKRVIAISRTQRVDGVDLSSEIPDGRVSRSLFDGFEVNTDAQPEIVNEIVDALIAAKDALRIER